MTESTNPKKAQLNKSEREQLEDIVTQMRERVEDNVRFQLTQRELDKRPEQIDKLDAGTEQLVEAIDLEATDGESWSEALDKYVNSVGYTIVNRLTALRCMEVREFIDEEVTVFKQNGLTPGAERLVQEEFLLEDEAILEAYHNICDTFAKEIEILFDRSSAYSLIDPDDDTFEELCEMLDSVPSRIWRADDVLGWVYEYYNVKLLDDLRRKGDREGLEPEDVPPANQFYTPHWVVRMLTDNSLGKLYLEHTGELQDVVNAQEAFSPDERKNRPLTPDESPDISDFCTYLVPSGEEGEPTDFEHPEELRVIDPACGSGHFLLYAFDVLERIWRAETDLANEKIPRKILQHNIYGVDLDMRACQLAAFNLYLKGRTRTEAEGADSFDMPKVGIVCADAKVADVDGVETVFEEVAGDDPKIKDALVQVLDAFEEVNGLGSLLDVRGTLGDLFEDDSDTEGVQITLGDDPTVNHTLGQVLHNLRMAVGEHQNSDSFLAQDLQSFVRLLDILSQDYDVSLMNPPYGSGNRMPRNVKKYVNKNYEYNTEYCSNFVEICNSLAKPRGRIGMLVKREFMFKKSYQDFREDFAGKSGSFDFLSEYGLGVLDNAHVRTVGSVLRVGVDQSPDGSFIRLHDLQSEQKEKIFIKTLGSEKVDGIRRFYQVPMEEFNSIPGTPISYSIPSDVRQLHQSRVKIDYEDSKTKSVGNAAQGMLTGNNDRFVRKHWETQNNSCFLPISNGGKDAWVLPQVNSTVQFGETGEELRRVSGSRFQNSQYYQQAGVTWTYIKETGRRFGYFPEDGIFGYSGSMLFPNDEYDMLNIIGVLNSDLYHALFLSLTAGRHWNPGEVGRIPWVEQLGDLNKIQQLVESQYSIQINRRSSNPVSPYYAGPNALPSAVRAKFFYEHPHNENAKLEESEIEVSDSIQTAMIKAEKTQISRARRIEDLSTQIDSLIYDTLEIPEKSREEIRQEIFLRTSESREDRKVPDLNSVSEVPENIGKHVKDLVHHFAMEAANKEHDGIIPIYSAGEQDSMLDHVISRFRNNYDGYGDDRLAEVDEALGNKSAAEEAYPNLRTFIENDLFDYHVSRMENTPILWKITSERLVTDSANEGFACFIDYHSLNPGILDRLANQYLEPRKSELRERRNAANRRQNDESLSTSERAEAADQYNRCVSGLNQISVFKSALRELGSSNEREFKTEDRELVENLAPKVATFREETRERVDILAELRERNSEEWFQDTFSDNFWNVVDKWQEEWIDALKDLERACKQYSRPTSEPVEAHLADLFDYFSRRLKGSDHYSSTGILFMTYYFEREGADFLDNNGEPLEKLKFRKRQLASLATGLDDPSIVDDEYLSMIVADKNMKKISDLQPLAEFKSLAEEIEDRCQIIDKRVPSNWADRALSEITTEGYHPAHKHGVEINIAPLAQADIMPETVEDDVL